MLDAKKNIKREIASFFFSCFFFSVVFIARFKNRWIVLINCPEAILLKSFPFPILPTFHFSVSHSRSIRISNKLHPPPFRVTITNPNFAARRSNRCFETISKVISICAWRNAGRYSRSWKQPAVCFQLGRQSKRTTSINYSFNFVQTKAGTYFRGIRVGWGNLPVHYTDVHFNYTARGLMKPSVRSSATEFG